MATFAPELITQIGPLPITNTFLHTIVTDVVLISIALLATKNLKMIPSGFQNMMESVIEALYSLVESIASSKKALEKIFPYAMTFFLFIFIANITSLLPGMGTFGFFKEHNEFVPLLRGATSDINVTLALAIISVIATHMLSIQVTGIRDYLSRYFSLNPINLYVGLLELISEFTKVISLSFRLFGNIYAGEIALSTISKLLAFVAPLPFLLLESLVSIVQALVFSVLTLVFMSVLTTPHHHSEAGEVIHE